MTLTVKGDSITTSLLITTHLATLASSQTVGWQSARVDNDSGNKGASGSAVVNALDYQILVSMLMANTAPANDKAMYVYLCPWYYDNSSNLWFPTDGGTATLPSGNEGSYTIALPNDLLLLGRLNYSSANMTLSGIFNIADVMPSMPDGWSLIIVNYTGAAVGSGASLFVEYTPYFETVG